MLWRLADSTARNIVRKWTRLETKQTTEMCIQAEKIRKGLQRRYFQPEDLYLLFQSEDLHNTSQTVKPGCTMGFPNRMREQQVVTAATSRALLLPRTACIHIVCIRIHYLCTKVNAGGWRCEQVFIVENYLHRRWRIMSDKKRLVMSVLMLLLLVI